MCSAPPLARRHKTGNEQEYKSPVQEKRSFDEKYQLHRCKQQQVIANREHS